MENNRKVSARFEKSSFVNEKFDTDTWQLFL